MDKIDHIEKSIIENIYALAKLKMITIKALEEKCDLGQGYLSRIKRQGDGTNMPIATVEKIANELGCNISQLLYGHHSVRNEDGTYYNMLLNKLDNDTDEGKLLWSNVNFQFDDNDKQIVYPENIDNHPLKAILRKGYVDEFVDKNGQKRREAYCYQSFLDDDSYGEQAFISFAYSCFLNSDVKLYLFFSQDFDDPSELIMVKDDTVYPLCGNINSENSYQESMQVLGIAIHNKTDCLPHLTDDIKKILNDYVFDEKQTEQK